MEQEQRQAYIGNRLYELCLMQNHQVSKSKYEVQSFTELFGEKPKDNRTVDELCDDVIQAFS